jgi:hypothetical protein
MLRSMKAALAASFIALPTLLCSVPAVANAEPDNTPAYIAVLDKNHVQYSSHDTIVHVGTNLCNELRNDILPPDQALQRIQNMGYSKQQTKVIAFAAVEAFCPDMDIDSNTPPKS